MSRSFVVTLLLLAASAGSAAAQGSAKKAVEIWQCFKYSSGEDNTLVTAIVDSGRTKGSLQVAGVRHEAAYKVEGFNRRWNFGPQADGSGYRYAFVIEPDGTGLYIDFRDEKEANASDVMHCRQAL